MICTEVGKVDRKKEKREHHFFLEFGFSEGNHYSKAPG